MGWPTYWWQKAEDEHITFTHFHVKKERNAVYPGRARILRMAAEEGAGSLDLMLENIFRFLGNTTGSKLLIVMRSLPLLIPLATLVGLVAFLRGPLHRWMTVELPGLIERHRALNAAEEGCEKLVVCRKLACMRVRSSGRMFNG